MGAFACKPGAALAVLALLAASSGCPGDVDVPVRRDGGPADSYWMPTPDWLPAQDTGDPPETGALDAAADTAAPSSTPGGPCPCTSPLVCVAGFCRKPCTKQACNAPASACAATESCLVTSSVTVCIPGAAKGKPCGAGAPCQSGLLCLSTSPSSPSGACYASCDASGSCGGGSTCYTSTASGCKYCYP